MARQVKRLRAAEHDGPHRFGATAPGAGPRHFAFHPDGRSLAIGYIDTNRVDILDGNTLGLISTPSSAGPLPASAK